MHMYSYMYMHMGKYTRYANTTENKVEKNPIAKSNDEKADITEMECSTGTLCGLSLFLLAPWSGAFSQLTV